MPSPTCLALDIGATNLKCGMVVYRDGRWRVTAAGVLTAPSLSFAGPEVFFTNLCRQLMRCANGVRFRRIALAVPGPFDAHNGMFARKAGKFARLASWSIIRALREQYRCGVTACNDTYAFGIGAVQALNSGKSELSVAVTIGTHVGIVFLHGSELATPDMGAPAGGGVDWLSDANPKARLALSAVPDWWKCADRLTIHYSRVAGWHASAKQVLMLADNSDGNAIIATRLLVTELTDVIVRVINTFRPKHVIVGGGMSRSFTVHCPVLREGLATLSYPIKVHVMLGDSYTLEGATIAGAHHKDEDSHTARA